tara:strand:- start:2902 stop:3288 length:387 start_codon:yes stop_codon:yes gene_type:complete
MKYFIILFFLSIYSFSYSDSNIPEFFSLFSIEKISKLESMYQSINSDLSKNTLKKSNKKIAPSFDSLKSLIIKNEGLKSYRLISEEFKVSNYLRISQYELIFNNDEKVNFTIKSLKKEEAYKINSFYF